MRSYLVLLLLVLVFACDTNTTNRNPFLQEFSFRFDINTNLPLYSALTNEGSAIYIGNEQAGTRGIFVIKTLASLNGYRAFEASCPNHLPNNCSTMTLDNSRNSVTCSCEDYNYTLFTGQLLNAPNDGSRFYNMLEYRVNASGNVISITN
jgi:nitrite reductase/ring-hydroxylating ferredoxin subunit